MNDNIVSQINVLGLISMAEDKLTNKPIGSHTIEDYRGISRLLISAAQIVDEMAQNCKNCGAVIDVAADVNKEV